MHQLVLSGRTGNNCAHGQLCICTFCYRRSATAAYGDHDFTYGHASILLTANFASAQLYLGFGRCLFMVAHCFSYLLAGMAITGDCILVNGFSGLWRLFCLSDNCFSLSRAEILLSEGSTFCTVSFMLFATFAYPGQLSLTRLVGDFLHGRLCTCFVFLWAFGDICFCFGSAL